MVLDHRHSACLQNVLGQLEAHIIYKARIGEQQAAVQSNQVLYAHLVITSQTCQGLVQVAAPCQLVGILKGLAIGKQEESLLLEACLTLSLNHLSAATRCTH